MTAGAPSRNAAATAALNPAAFTPSPVGETGNFPRNGLRSPYSINQTDLALRRRFNLKLDVRAEYFNVFNHPMFGLPGSTCNPNTFWGFQGGTARSSFGKVCPGTSSTNVDEGGEAFNGQSAVRRWRPALGSVHAEGDLLGKDRLRMSRR